MINHARAMLSNRSAADRPPVGAYGEEYTPPGFIAVDDARDLKQVRALLLGRDPDALYLNVRLRILLEAAHATPSVDRYLRSLDPRLTYLGHTDPIVTGTVIQASPAGTQAAALNLAGDPAPDELDGVTVFGYRITASTDHLLVNDLAYGSWRRYERGGEPPVLSCGLSAQLVGVWEPAAWDVSVVAPSATGLADIYASLRRPSQALSAVLAATDPRWSELWKRGIGIAARIAGVVAAVVEATGGARGG